ncbi:hypothetical protein GWI33_017093 [Rhynchophorus ferrugineus]|uniref:Uncharacterized protein n=1 Tax=Rhynchophorus ferrugineus TaxID=354439 RepID=A0A834HZQ2_RHYFE|nr:hypothetical protein GWI33_017093 [Rhynchophorus ferrugineus]
MERHAPPLLPPPPPLTRRARAKLAQRKRVSPYGGGVGRNSCCLLFPISNAELPKFEILSEAIRASYPNARAPCIKYARKSLKIPHYFPRLNGKLFPRLRPSVIPLLSGEDTCNLESKNVFNNS